MLRPGRNLNGRLAEPQVYGLERVPHLARIVADRSHAPIAELASFSAPPALYFVAISMGLIGVCVCELESLVLTSGLATTCACIERCCQPLWRGWWCSEPDISERSRRRLVEGG